MTFVSTKKYILFSDMIAATSVLQQQAGDIRLNKINWQSYMQYVLLLFFFSFLCSSQLNE